MSSFSSLRRLLLPAIGIILVGATILLAKNGDGSRTGNPTLPKHVERFITAEGRVSAYPDASVAVSSERAGIVTRLAVLEKDVVTRGQLIAQLRSDDLDASLAEARARVEEADANIRLFSTESRRAKELWEKEVGTKQAFDRAERDLDAAVAQKATAVATVERLEAELAKTRIVAPIDGVVVTRNVNAGEAVEARQTIVEIANLSKTRVEAEVDEFDAGRVKRGSKVTIGITGQDETTWRGHVEEIPDTVVGRKLKPEDPGRPTDTRVLLVKVAFDEPTRLKLGQRVRVKIEE